MLIHKVKNTETNTKKTEKKIAVLGTAGSFHELAANKYFGVKSEKLFYNSFNGIVDSVKNGNAAFAIMAIENSVAGSIISNYPLLKNSGLNISGELVIRIKQNLIAVPGTKLENISKICTHFMAIEQCRAFLDKHPHIEVIPGGDTAGNALKIKTENLRNTATIAGTNAAKKNGLSIICKGIETKKNNFTRFLILGKKYQTLSCTSDKASISFCLSHEKGSLSAVLSVLSFYGVNLSKIQSVPVPGRIWKYDFYADLLFNDYKRYRSAISAIKPLTKDLIILGEYKSI